MSFAFSSEALLDCGGGCDNIVVHDCLSTGGQSGSPIFSMNGTSNYTVRRMFVIKSYYGNVSRYELIRHM